MDFISAAIAVYGRGRVYVHLIAGLGEKPSELINTMHALARRGARIALFRYTPIPGLQTRFPGVSIEDYRVLQVARALVEEGLDPWDYIDCRGGRLLLHSCPPVSPARAFLTSGCPGCNRPFYNESPRGPIYNYPSPTLLKRDLARVLGELRRRSPRGLWGCLERWLYGLSG